MLRARDFLVLVGVVLCAAAGASAQTTAAAGDAAPHRRAATAATASNAAPDGEKVDLLWVAHAARITFERPSKADPAQPTTMTMHGVAPIVTWFSNRPARHTGVLDTQLWSATKASVAKAEAEAAAAVAAAVKDGRPTPPPTPDPAANLTAAGLKAMKAAPFSEVWATQPPNAAAVGQWGPDAKPRVVVVVLREPVYSRAAGTLTFSIELLANHTAWPADEAPSVKGPDNTADADALAVAEASAAKGPSSKGLAADAAIAEERRRAAGGVARVVELGPDGEVRTKEEAVARDADGRQIPVASLREAAAAAAVAKAPEAVPPPKRAPVDLAEYTPGELAERKARAAAPPPMLELGGPATLFIDNWGMFGPGWGPGSSNNGCFLPPGCLSITLCGICGGWGGGLIG